MQKYIETIYAKVESWLELLVSMVPNFLLAMVIVIITILIARLLKNIFYKTINKFSNNEAINKLMSSITFVILLTFGLFIALRILNLDKTVTSLLAGLGIAGLALGFAFKDIAANFIAGIYLAIKSPINVGDIIEYQNINGIVKEIGLRASSIKTFQGQDVIMPNRLIMEDKYTHYTINNERRIDLDVGISYGDDLDKVEEVTLRAINSITFINKQKPVDLYFKEFGDSAIIFTVRYWVPYVAGDYIIYLRALSQGIKNIKKAYEKNNISITFPIRTIDFGIKGGKSLGDILSENQK